MNHKSLFLQTIGLMLVMLLLVACGASATPTPAPTLTSTPVPPTPTPEPTPTSTPVPPTPTPEPTPTSTPIPPTATPVPTNTPVLTTGRIEGKVFRSDTEEFFANVKVGLWIPTSNPDEKFEAETTTDEQGNYFFDDLPPGGYLLDTVVYFENREASPCQEFENTVGGMSIQTYMINGVGYMAASTREAGRIKLIVQTVGEASVSAGDVVQVDLDLFCHAVSSTAITDPELEAFAIELIDITSRLREGIRAALTAPTEEEMKAAFATLAEINSDAQNLSVPDNEVAQELVPYLLDCTDHLHEDMSIDQFLQATQDCTLYIQLYDELFGTDDSSSE